MNKLKKKRPFILLCTLLLSTIFLIDSGITAQNQQAVEQIPYESYSYDSAGRLVQITYGNGYSILYSFDANGAISRVTITDGDTVFINSFE